MNKLYSIFMIKILFQFNTILRQYVFKNDSIISIKINLYIINSNFSYYFVHLYT